MRLHHSSTLTAEYFFSYAQLVMNSRELSVEDTQQFMEDFSLKMIRLCMESRLASNFYKL